jgi:4-alpha-glucanotransferase
VLSYRPLYFERTADAEFARPKVIGAGAGHHRHARPADAVRFLGGRDIAARRRLRLYPDENAPAEQLAARSRDRGRLMSALERAGFSAADAPRRMTVDLMIAVHRFLARTPAAVMAVQLEDVFGQDTQVNLPSTTETNIQTGDAS